MNPVDQPSTPGFQVIQQWQYTGPTIPSLFSPRALRNAKNAGITSLQSYVTWAEIEKNQGTFDFSSYDPLVEAMAGKGLKWVPFLISGPAYATPAWFHQSRETVYATCLEHGRRSRIQSIWNPHLVSHVRRFLSSVSEHYSDHSIFESVLLGVSGNWGESIFPATGGFSGGFHTHPGWWCADVYARGDFRNAMLRQFGSLDAINKRWQTFFMKPNHIRFPRLSRRILSDLFHLGLKALPRKMRPILGNLRTVLSRHGGGRLAFREMPTLRRPKEAEIGGLLHLLDFVEWYRDSMTNWCTTWLSMARDCFPASDLYIVSGGSGAPVLGADFSGQTKAAARFRAGIRITNQNDDYRDSFILTRLVASASKAYRTYFTTEEAGLNRPHGVTMRIFDALTTHARGAYFKGLVGTGEEHCTGRYFPPGKPTAGVLRLAQALEFEKDVKPLRYVAVFHPDTAIMLQSSILGRFYAGCRQLRTRIDFDLADEQMVLDGFLSRFCFLIMFPTPWTKAKVVSSLLNWVRAGGILIGIHPTATRAIDGHSAILVSPGRSSARVKPSGKGFLCCVNPSKQNPLEVAVSLIFNERESLPWKGVRQYPKQATGKYVARLHNGFIFYDPVSHKISRTEL